MMERLVLLWILWCDLSGVLLIRRKVVHVVRDRVFLPGPAGVWDGGWVVVAATPFTFHDIEL